MWVRKFREVEWRMRRRRQARAQLPARLNRWENRLVSIAAKSEGAGSELAKYTAFLSYAHHDDADGLITWLRTALAVELRVQTGADWDVFQDKTGIALGQPWQAAIDSSITATGFLLVAMSPSYFQSGKCLEELKAFRATEQRLGRTDLIFPLYLVELWPASLLETEAVKFALERQYHDLRELRVEERSGVPWKKAIRTVAKDIRRSSERGTPLTPVSAARVLTRHGSASLEEKLEAAGAWKIRQFPGDSSRYGGRSSCCMRRRCWPATRPRKRWMLGCPPCWSER